MKKEEINIIDEKIRREINNIKIIDSIKILANKIVEVNLILDEEINANEIRLKIAKIIKIDLKYPGVKFNVKFKAKSLENTQDIESKITYIAITSGKGGVGKSTVSANLAKALSNLGKNVGLIDIDIYGASIPFLYNMEIKPLNLDDNGKIIPAKHEKIEVVSTEFFVPKEKPIMWRAPIASQMVKFFFESVSWQQDLDYIIIDMPPGTGDIALDITTLVPKSKMIVVTAADLNAAGIALKTGIGAKELGHKIIGVIENMSYYYNACSKTKEELFGSGGGSFVAKKLGVDLLAQIPILNLNQKDSNDNFLSIKDKIYQTIANLIINKLK